MSLDLSGIAADPETMPILSLDPDGDRWVGFAGGGGIIVKDDFEWTPGMYAIVSPRYRHGQFLDGRVVLIERAAVLS